MGFRCFRDLWNPILIAFASDKTSREQNIPENHSSRPVSSVQFTLVLNNLVACRVHNSSSLVLGLIVSFCRQSEPREGCRSRRSLRARHFWYCFIDGYMGVSCNVVMKGTTGKIDDFRSNSSTCNCHGVHINMFVFLTGGGDCSFVCSYFIADMM